MNAGNLQANPNINIEIYVTPELLLPVLCQHHEATLEYPLQGASLGRWFSNIYYDSYFIIQELGKCNKKINIIPNNSEKFLSLILGKIVFKD